MKADRDDSLRQYAAKAVLKRARAMAKEVKSARDGASVETVHDLRVAARRLSTALTLFEDQFPRRRTRSWSKRLCRLRRALGKTRDLDVQEAFLEDFLRQSHEFLGGLAEVEYRPGIERLLVCVRRHRTARRRKVSKAAHRFERHDVLSDLKRAAKALRATCRAAEGDGPAVRERSRVAILKHLEDLLALEPCLDQPAAIAEHHAMRTAAKRLRYTLEVFRPQYGARTARFIAAARKCQQRLGAIHDCDVWVEFLPRFLREEGALPARRPAGTRRAARLKPGLLFLQDERRRQRQRYFKDFVAFWRKLRQDGVWERLVDLLSAEPAAERRTVRPHRSPEAA
jgi:CHAD domain-containing protein